MNDEIKNDIERAKEIVHQIDNLETELGELLGYSAEEETEEEEAPAPKPKKNTEGNPVPRKIISDAIILKMMKRVDAGEKVSVVCEEFGMSNPTFYTRRIKIEKKETSPQETKEEKSEPIDQPEKQTEAKPKQFNEKNTREQMIWRALKKGYDFDQIFSYTRTEYPDLTKEELRMSLTRIRTQIENKENVNTAGAVTQEIANKVIYLRDVQNRNSVEIARELNMSMIGVGEIFKANPVKND